MADGFKSVVISPLNGLLDTRSSADQQVSGSFCWKQNLQLSSDGKLQQAEGFQRPYETGVLCPYKNWDFHDQNVSLADREPPTMLYFSTANDGTRRLYMATKTRIFLLDETAGTWTQLSGGPFGADGSLSLTQTRFKCDQLQDNLFFVNGVDPVQYTAVGSGTVQEVVGLQTAGDSGGAVAVSKPLVVIQYQSVLMIMNVTEGGTRIASRIWWSDANDGLFWGTGIVNPSTSAMSIADFQDLTYGERILGAIELQGYLVVFTDKAIWKCVFQVDAASTPPSATLVCVSVYSESESRDRCLAYENALCSDGSAIYYASRDAIYKYDFYMSRPERTEFIFRSSNLIFQDGIDGASIDETSANSPVLHYWPERKELHFSWPVPDASLNSDPGCDIVPPILSSGLNRHTLVFNLEWETSDLRDYGFNAATNFSSNIKRSAQSQLATEFFISLTDDYCLKILGHGYSRIIYNPLADDFSVVGYYPLFRLLIPLQDLDADKEVNSVIVDGACGADDGNVFSLRMGVAHSNVSINSDLANCGIIWYACRDIPARCIMQYTPEQYAALKRAPAYDHRWNRLVKGRLIFLEWTLKKVDGSAPVAGNGLTLTRISAKAIEV